MIATRAALLTFLAASVPGCEAQPNSGSLCWVIALVVGLAVLGLFLYDHHQKKSKAKFQEANASVCLSVDFREALVVDEVVLARGDVDGGTDRDVVEKFRDRLPADVFQRLRTGES